MMLTEEELRDNWHEQYLYYCKSSLSAKTIVACHTKVFKQLNDMQVRIMGYWWLRYKYGFTSYYQNHKIPNSLVLEVNQALIKTVQTGFTEENLFNNLLSVFTSNKEFFDYVYNCHLENQQQFNLRQKSEKLNCNETNKSSNYIPELVIIIFVICFILLC